MLHHYGYTASHPRLKMVSGAVGATDHVRACDILENMYPPSKGWVIAIGQLSQEELAEVERTEQQWQNR